MQESFHYFHLPLFSAKEIRIEIKGNERDGDRKSDIYVYIYVIYIYIYLHI